VAAAFISAAFLGTLLLPACDEKKAEPCHANVDCAGTKACVWGRCIDDVAKCESIGAFEDLYEELPVGLDSVSELHTTVDVDGAVHYCAYGTIDGDPSAWYGTQTAWSAFTSSEMMLESGDPIRCGALAVSSDGVLYALSRSGAVVYKSAGMGAWGAVPLDGLQGIEAQGAVAGDRAVISLSPDADGGVYLAISLGFALEDQALYLAHAKLGEVEVLVNGWDEDGDHTVTGHAPQILIPSPPGGGTQGGGLRLLFGRPVSFDVLLADEAMGVYGQVEGIHPRGAAGPDGGVLAMYLDHNYQLHLDSVEGDSFEELAVLGEVEIDESGDGQVPWIMAVDANDTAHLLIEDEAQGGDALTYGTVLADGTVSDAIVLTTSLAAGLPGMQRYALGTDICGRATIVTVEESAELGVVLKVREGR
jgi:hypothetical protein